MDTEAHAIDRAEWFIAHKRRWPFLIALALGAVLAAYVIPVGHGRIKAFKSLPGSRAELLALKPPPVDANRNAAIVWRRAFAEMRDWPGFPEDDPCAPRSAVDWRDPLTYSPDSPVRKHLEANRAALELARRAAELTECDWDLDYTRGGPIDSPHLTKLVKLGRLMRVDAIFAAQSNDWAAFERTLRTAEAAARDAYDDPLLMGYLVAVAFDQMALDTIDWGLSAPGASPPAAVLRRLMDHVRARARTLPSFARAIETERRTTLLFIDSMGTGDLRPLEHVLDASAAKQQPMVFNWYSAIWRSDRDYFDSMMHCFWLLKSGRKDECDPRWLSELDRFSFCGRRPGDLARYISWLMMPIGLAISPRETQNRVMWRLAEVRIALHQYRMASGNRWPERLDDLGLVPETLIDSCDFDEKRFRYRVEDDGSALVWSVGRDHVDNDGNLTGTYERDFGFRAHPPAPRPPLDEEVSP